MHSGTQLIYTLDPIRLPARYSCLLVPASVLQYCTRYQVEIDTGSFLDKALRQPLFPLLAFPASCRMHVRRHLPALPVATSNTRCSCIVIVTYCITVFLKRWHYGQI